MRDYDHLAQILTFFNCGSFYMRHIHQWYASWIKSFVVWPYTVQISNWLPSNSMLLGQRFPVLYYGRYCIKNATTRFRSLGHDPADLRINTDYSSCAWGVHGADRTDYDWSSEDCSRFKNRNEAVESHFDSAQGATYISNFRICTHRGRFHAIQPQLLNPWWKGKCTRLHSTGLGSGI